MGAILAQKSIKKSMVHWGLQVGARPKRVEDVPPKAGSEVPHGCKVLTNIAWCMRESLNHAV